MGCPGRDSSRKNETEREFITPFSGQSVSIRLQISKPIGSPPHPPHPPPESGRSLLGVPETIIVSTGELGPETRESREPFVANWPRFVCR